MSARVDRRALLGSLAAAPALWIAGQGQAGAALDAMIAARMPGLDIAANAVLRRAVAAHRDAGVGLAARVAAAADPAAALAGAAAEADASDCLIAGGWFLARFDLVLLAAREVAG